MKELFLGVLGFQGDVEEHIAASKLALEDLQLRGRVRAVKKPDDLKTLDGLVIPGGESTVIGRLSTFNQTINIIKERAKSGMPVLGTCGGLVLLATRLYDRVVGATNQPSLGLLDVVVERNSFGRQRESFEEELSIPRLGEKMFRGVFIRAPVVKEIGPSVQVLAKLNDHVVAVQQGMMIGTSFHPELTGDTRLHRYFVRMIIGGDQNPDRS